jgi:hypothetical protein
MAMDAAPSNSNQSANQSAPGDVSPGALDDFEGSMFDDRR